MTIWLVSCFECYAVAAIFQPCNGGCSVTYNTITLIKSLSYCKLYMLWSTLDIYTLHRHRVQGVLKADTEEERSHFLVFLLSLSADIQGIDKDIMLQNERSDKLKWTGIHNDQITLQLVWWQWWGERSKINKSRGRIHQFNKILPLTWWRCH